MSENPNIWGNEGCLINSETGLLCTACCQALIVFELNKPAGTPCQHITEIGCGIFLDPKRPTTCHGYQCGEDYNFDRRRILIETAFLQGKVTESQMRRALELNELNRELFG